MPRHFITFVFSTIVFTGLMGCDKKSSDATPEEKPVTSEQNKNKDKSVEKEDEPSTDSKPSADKTTTKPAKNTKGTDAQAKGDDPQPKGGPSIADTLKAMDEEDGAADHLDKLLGSDQNGDGLRDDIESYIDSLDNTDEQKQALRQHALALSKAVVLGADGDSSDGELRDVTRKIGDASSCLYSVYGVSDASGMAAELQKRVANTKERFQAYDKFNGEVSGLVMKLPVGDTCDDGQ